MDYSKIKTLKPEQVKTSLLDDIGNSLFILVLIAIFIYCIG